MTATYFENFTPSKKTVVGLVRYCSDLRYDTPYVPLMYIYVEGRKMGFAFVQSPLTLAHDDFTRELLFGLPRSLQHTLDEVGPESFFRVVRHAWVMTNLSIEVVRANSADTTS
jgi:hypothetical protein